MSSATSSHSAQAAKQNAGAPGGNWCLRLFDGGGGGLNSWLVGNAVDETACDLGSCQGACQRHDAVRCWFRQAEGKATIAWSAVKAGIEF